MTRPRPKIGAELLPVFLILACMVGTCVLVIATYRRASAARKMRAKVPVSVAAVAPPPPPRVEPPPEPPLTPPEPPPRPPEEDPTRTIVARIGAEEAEQLLEAQAADRKAEALERARQAAEAESRRWRRRESLVRSQVDSLSERARKLEEEADTLALERDALARERDATKAVLAKAQMRSSYAVLPNKAENGTWRRPIIVECSDGAVKLQPNGPSFTLLDLSAVLGARQSPLVAAVVHEVVRAQAKATPDGAPAVPYVFFIVRPDGIRPYYEARARLEPLGIAFGYELVEQNMELDYPDLDNLDEWDGSAPLRLPLVMTGSNETPRASRVSGRGRGDSPDAFVWPGRSQGPPAGGDSPGSGEAPGGGPGGQELSGRDGLPGMGDDRGGGELAGGPGGEPGPRGGFGPGGHGSGGPLGVSSPPAGLPGDQPGRDPQGGLGGGSGARGGFGPGGLGGDGPLGGSSPLAGLPGDQDGRESQGGPGGGSGQGGGSGRGVVSPHGPAGDQVDGESRGGNGGGPGRDPKDPADLFVWPTSPPGAPTGTDASEPGGSPGGPDLSGPGGPVGPGGGVQGGLAGVTGPRGGSGMGNRGGGTRPGTSPPSAGPSGDGAAGGIGLVPATPANDPPTGDRSGSLIALRPDGLPGLKPVTPIPGSTGEGTSSSSGNAGQVMSAPEGSTSQGTPPPEENNGPGTFAPSGNDGQGTSTPNGTMGQGTSPPSGNDSQGVPAQGGSSATQGDPQAQSGNRPGAMTQTPGVPRWVTGPRSTMAPLENLASGRGAFAPSSGEPASPSDGSGQSVSSGSSGRKRVPLGSSSAGGGSTSGNPAGDVGLGGSSGQPGNPDDPFILPQENASTLDKKLKVEVPMEIVVSCGPNGVVLHPGGYRISPGALKGKGAILAKELRSIVRLRQQVDPMIRPRPSIEFLVEPGGFDTYHEARRQTVISGLDWPVSLQVADTKVLDFFPGGRF